MKQLVEETSTQEKRHGIKANSIFLKTKLKTTA